MIAPTGATGGIVAAYAWDVLGGGFPTEPLLIELRAIGANASSPPSAIFSLMNARAELWAEAGLDAVATREIRMQRTFNGFEEFWNIAKGSSLGKVVASTSADDVELVKTRARRRLLPNGASGITYEARANALTGRVLQER